MKTTWAFITAVTGASAHCVITSIEGANGVTMPGLSVADGTPRDCSSNSCGSQADTSIIRDSEIESGEVGPLGRTQGNGPVDPNAMIQNFMQGGGAAPTNDGAEDSVGVEDDLSMLREANNGEDGGEGEEADDPENQEATNNTDNANRRRQLLGGLLGGGGAEDEEDDGGAGGALGGLLGGGGGADDGEEEDDGGAGGGLGGLLGGGGGGGIGGLLGGGGEGEKNEFATENSVAASAGNGSTSGLPTCSDTGEVTVTMRQINQDGAGPMEAMIDGSSGGTDMAAFQEAEVTQDVPGFVAGLSLTTTTDFPMTIQMPEGMTCDGTAGGEENVCIVRVRNNTPAGPFGGSAAFTQSTESRKRALAYRLKKRMEINRTS